jgi:hypothetical protein
MSKAQLVVTAVTVERRRLARSRAYWVARSWVYALLARYREEGEAAFEPRSRRPKTSPSAISDDAADLIIRLRKDLAGPGWSLPPRPSSRSRPTSRHYAAVAPSWGATWPPGISGVQLLFRVAHRISVHSSSRTGKGDPRPLQIRTWPALASRCPGQRAHTRARLVSRGASGGWRPRREHSAP